jgi:hypothetical protein
VDLLSGGGIGSFRNRVGFNGSGTLLKSYIAGPFLFNNALTFPVKVEKQP